MNSQKSMETKFVFITGLGRSGTKFLTELLSFDPSICCKHEFIGDRNFSVLSWYLREGNYSKYYLEGQKKEILEKYPSNFFIDVNSNLQNCTDHLQEVFNPLKIYHLVRNPLEVVSSLFKRRFIEDIQALPENDDELQLWLKNDLFTQICLSWKNTTEKLLSENTELIIFNQLISDYSYCSEKILQPLQLSISKDEWEKTRNKKINSTKSTLYRKIYAFLKKKRFNKNVIGHYSRWTNDQKETFSKICLPTAKKCGFEIDLTK